ncbi:MAG: transposase zinc-binding domain-containing protein, partial [Elusimicrobia bacterium]|nr:transposase zinc-binding domain-containing protein [Elusimicrobiota bacterium]
RHSVKIPHSCKSRFCSSCGKKATDIWIENSFNTLPNSKWQHITFTMPDVLWDFFWVNRYLMNKAPAIAAGIIKQLSLQKRFIAHIPDAYFRNIRYYGFLSHRTRTKLLPIVYNLLNQIKDIAKKGYIHWRQMIKNTFHYDPLTCWAWF